MSEVILYDKSAISNRLKIEAARLNLQNLLDVVSAIEWTRENIAQDLLAPARDAVKALKDFKDAGKRPHLDANTAYEEAYKDSTGLLIQISTQKLHEKTQLLNQIEKERQKEEAERRRITEINTYQKNFIVSVSNEVISAKTAADIVFIEKKIGGEMNRKSFHAEFYDSFVKQINEIRPLIAERKDLVRQQQKTNEKLDKMPDNNAELLDKKEDLGIFMLQNKAEMQDVATNIATEEVYVGQSIAPYVAPTRRQWKFEVTDINLLFKHSPELIILETNDAAIRDLMKSKKEKGELKEGSEINMPGIRFYQEKKYK